MPDPVALTGDQARDPEDDKDERRVYGVDPRESLLKYKSEIISFKCSYDIYTGTIKKPKYIRVL